MIIYFIVLLAALNQISFKGNKIIVTLYAMDLGANAVNVGILAALLSLFPLFLAVYAGKISDRYGFRLPLLGGSFGSAAGLLLPFFFPHLNTLYLSQALIGISQLFFHVTVQSLIGSWGNKEDRARNFSTFSLGGSVAGLIGPLFTGFSIDHFGFLLTYLGLAIMAVVPGFAFLFFPHLLPQKANHQEDEKKDGSVIDLLMLPSLRKTLIASGMILTGIELYTFYLPIYGSSIGLSASMIGAILSVHAAAFFVIRLIMPALIKKYEEEKVLTYCLFLSGTAYLLIPLYQNIVFLAAISFILGLGLGCGQPLSTIVTYNRSPKGRKGEALGLRLTVNKLTQVAVPLVFGTLGSVFGLWPVFWANSLLLLSGGWINRIGSTEKYPSRPSDLS
ncbi:MFS transporter [Bacillaceae bacterium]